MISLFLILLLLSVWTRNRHNWDIICGNWLLWIGKTSSMIFFCFSLWGNYSIEGVHSIIPWHLLITIILKKWFFFLGQVSCCVESFVMAGSNSFQIFFVRNIFIFYFTFFSNIIVFLNIINLYKIFFTTQHTQVRRNLLLS